MPVEHRGKRPSVHETAYVAPTAVLCGDVRVGPGSRVLFGGSRSATRRGSSRRGTATADPARLGGVQRTLDFPGTVYGLSRDATARQPMERQTEWFGAHRDDRPVD